MGENTDEAQGQLSLAAPRIASVALLLLGLPMLVGGALLLSVGGSPYYACIGLASAVAGVLAWQGKPRAFPLVAAMILVTLAWSFWEVGLDFWALVPRLWPFLALAAWLGLPKTPVRLRSAAWSTKRRAKAVGSLLTASAAGLLLHHVTGMEIVDPAYAGGTVAAAKRVESSEASSWGGEWRFDGNNAGGARFSPLRQINRQNVKDLEVAWTYRVGYGDDNLQANLEVTPLKIGNRLYICTGFDDVIALDTVTGKEAWRYRAHTDRKGFVYRNCRGVSYYAVPNATGVCATRIYSTTLDGALLAFDAETGQSCSDFGKGGKVSLLEGMGQFDRGYYFFTQAPAVVRGKIVLGGWIADGQYVGEPSGVVRAFDAVTGQLSWAWDMGRPDRKGAPPPGETYTHSTPNSWGDLSSDEELGLVFLPTGNAVPDYFGGLRRPFDDKYTSAVVALDAETGTVRWSFQLTHHDLWDYDVSARPLLVDIPTSAGVVKGLIQTSKRAQVFVLDRATGKPLRTVVERAVPQGGIAPGERLSPTQPYSVEMPQLQGPALSERMMWGLSPLDQLWCRYEFRNSRYDGEFTPPGLGRYNVVYPGYGGGQNWGKVAVDVDRGLLITNTNRIANRTRLVTRAEADAAGSKPMSSKSHSDIGGYVPQAGTPYAADIRPFLSFLGAPCQQPPYGMLTAIDIASGKLVWQKPIGSAKAAGPFGLRSHIPLDMGMPNLAGPTVTRGGLTFIAATKDEAIRAFDTTSGDLLWQKELPAGGQATPMTYLGKDGRQYVVIAAGGHYGVASKRGDYIIAYALPRAAAKR